VGETHTPVWVKKEKRKHLGMLFTFWWCIWKEHNKRIFKNKECSSHELARLVQDEIGLQQSVLAPLSD
jgi:hypothetical protein